MNIKDKLFLEKYIDENDEVFNYIHDTFKLNKNEIEADYIISMNIAKKLKK